MTPCALRRPISYPQTQDGVFGSGLMIREIGSTAPPA